MARLASTPAAVAVGGGAAPFCFARISLSSPPLEHHLSLDDHVSDQSIRRVWKSTQPVTKPVIGHDSRVELTREGENEIVRVRARGRLAHDSTLNELFVAATVVDLVSQRRIDDDDGLEALFGHLLADRDDVRKLRLF